MVAFSSFNCKFDARLEREFKECDENSDGLIDIDEFSKYLKKCFEKITTQLNLKFFEIFNNSKEDKVKFKKMVIEGRKEDEETVLNKMEDVTTKYDVMMYKELLENREVTKNKILDLFKHIDNLVKKTGKSKSQ